ncbi:MAG TPA: hypothetical protein VKK61_07805 [Tepidisphaeraceae bacterium]|nr:hypothetical protein [Tepidisphaeraceae bacterium]
MHRWHIAIASILLLIGCESKAPYPRDATDAALFGPSAMRVHPIFTQVKDWTNDNHPDGIEALIEFQDQFGDPTKASGKVIFELYEYRKHDPDPRGERLVNPWIGDLSTLDAQQERWNRTSRTYSFQLAWDQIKENESYVLTAEFQANSGARFFDQIVLEGKQPEPTSNPTSPSTAPTTQP